MKVGYFYSLTLYCAVAIVNILSYTPLNMLPLALFLVLLTFLAFAWTIIEAQSVFDDHKSGRIVYYDHPTKDRPPYSLGQLAGNIPTIVKVLTVVSVLYAFFNFFICVISLVNGNPDLVDGIPCLMYRGHLVRELTWAEYYALRGVERRMISGSLLPFAAIPLAFFSGARKTEQKLKG